MVSTRLPELNSSILTADKLGEFKKLESEMLGNQNQGSDNSNQDLNSPGGQAALKSPGGITNPTNQSMISNSNSKTPSRDIFRALLGPNIKKIVSEKV